MFHRCWPEVRWPALDDTWLSVWFDSEKAARVAQRTIPLHNQHMLLSRPSPQQRPRWSPRRNYDPSRVFGTLPLVPCYRNPDSYQSLNLFGSQDCVRDAFPRYVNVLLPGPGHICCFGLETGDFRRL